MGASNIKGITIKIDGETTELQKSLSKVDTALKSTQSSLRDVNKLLKLDPKNTELLTQKQKLLKDAISQTESRLQKLKGAQDQFAQGTAEWDGLQREIVETEVKLKDLEKQYKDFGSVAAQQIKAAGEDMKNVGDKLTGVGSKMSTAVTLPIVGGFTLAAKSASNFEENLNKVDVAFGKDADQVKAWADVATEQFGLSKNAALEATSLFGDMGTAMGLSTEEAAQMSTSLAGLAGDLSSFKNVGIDQAMTALKGVFTGETESLKNLGVVMTQTNLKQFAEDLGLVYDNLSQAEIVTLRYQYVLQATSNAQGDYARTSDGTANSIRTLQATLDNLLAELGTALLPIITPIIQKITEWAKKFSELDESTRNIIVVVGLVAAAIGPLLVVIGSVISTIGTIMTMAPALGAVISALTGPIGLVIAAIAAAVLAGVQLYQNWDYVKEKCAEFAASVSEKWNALKDYLIERVNLTKQNILNAWEAIKTTVTTIVENITTTVKTKWEEIKTAITTAINNAKEVVTTAASGIYETMKENADKTVNYLKELPAKALQWGKDLINNFIDGIKDAWRSGIDFIKGIAEDVADFIGFSEPEKGPLSNFHTFAPDMMKLYAQGIRDNMYLVTDQMQALSASMAMAAQRPASIYLTNNTVLNGRVIASAVNEELGFLL